MKLRGPGLGQRPKLKLPRLGQGPKLKLPGSGQGLKLKLLGPGTNRNPKLYEIVNFVIFGQYLTQILKKSSKKPSTRPQFSKSLFFLSIVFDKIL